MVDGHLAPLDEDGPSVPTRPAPSVQKDAAVDEGADEEGGAGYHDDDDGPEGEG